MSMQMVVSFPEEKATLPEIKWNYEGLKAEITEKLQNYSAAVVTDPASYKGAKTDRANLSALGKAINDEKIRVKKLYNEPVALFEAQVKEVLAIIENTKAPIDDEIRKYEEDEAQKKRDEIEAYYNVQAEAHKSIEEFCRLESISNPKWMNATYKLDDIRKEIDAAFDQTEKDIASIEILKSPFETSLKQTYTHTRDVGAALKQHAELTEIAEKEAARKAEEAERRASAEKAEAERKAEFEVQHSEQVERVMNKGKESTEPLPVIPPTVQPEYTVILKISGRMDALKELKVWMQENNLTFEVYKEA